MPPFVKAVAEVMIVQENLIDAIETETLACRFPGQRRLPATNSESLGDRKNFVREFDVLLQTHRALLDVAPDLVLSVHDLVERRVHVAGVIREQRKRALRFLVDPSSAVGIQPFPEGGF